MLKKTTVILMTNREVIL